MEKLIQILMRRDGLSRQEAKELILLCRQMVDEGADPEEVLHDELGLEPDFIFDLIGA